MFYEGSEVHFERSSFRPKFLNKRLGAWSKKYCKSLTSISWLAAGCLVRIATGCIILNNNRDSLIVLMNNEQKFELTTSVKTRFLLDFFIHLFVYLFAC